MDGDWDDVSRFYQPTSNFCARWWTLSSDQWGCSLGAFGILDIFREHLNADNSS
jgi:hypothetical protein